MRKLAICLIVQGIYLIAGVAFASTTERSCSHSSGVCSGSCPTGTTCMSVEGACACG